MQRKKVVPIWPMRRVVQNGAAHFSFPFPTGETMHLPVADGEQGDVERLAQSCVRQRAKTWARRTFPAAFAGL
jgi:hypothetical protein